MEYEIVYEQKQTRTAIVTANSPEEARKNLYEGDNIVVDWETDTSDFRILEINLIKED